MPGRVEIALVQVLVGDDQRRGRPADREARVVPPDAALAVWGVDGGLDPNIEEFTADLNMKLGNLPVAPAAKDVIEPRFVDAALKKFGAYQSK